MQDQLLKIEDLILAEVNVKEMEYLPSDNDFIKKKIKPNFVILGKKLGGKMKTASNVIAALSQDSIRRLEQSGSLEIDLEGEPYLLQKDEVDIQSEDVEGWMVASRNAFTVALDVQLTKDLEQEGYARELINRIQKIRKDIDLELTDKIMVTVQSNPLFDDSFTRFNDYICAEILAEKIVLETGLEKGLDAEIEGKTLKINVIKK